MLGAVIGTGSRPRVARWRRARRQRWVRRRCACSSPLPHSPSRPWRRCCGGGAVEGSSREHPTASGPIARGTSVGRRSRRSWVTWCASRRDETWIRNSRRCGRRSSVTAFLAGAAPVRLQPSCTGCFRRGAALLVERGWVTRTDAAERVQRARRRACGLGCMTKTARGEKGFHYLDRVRFATNPTGAAMRAHFRACGDPETARCSHDSSMEQVARSGTRAARRAVACHRAAVPCGEAGWRLCGASGTLPELAMRAQRGAPVTDELARFGSSRWTRACHTAAAPRDRAGAGRYGPSGSALTGGAGDPALSAAIRQGSPGSLIDRDAEPRRARPCARRSGSPGIMTASTPGAGAASLIISAVCRDTASALVQRTQARMSMTMNRTPVARHQAGRAGCPCRRRYRRAESG